MKPKWTKNPEISKIFHKVQNAKKVQFFSSAGPAEAVVLQPPPRRRPHRSRGGGRAVAAAAAAPRPQPRRGRRHKVL